MLAKRIYETLLSEKDILSVISDRNERVKRVCDCIISVPLGDFEIEQPRETILSAIRIDGFVYSRANDEEDRLCNEVVRLARSIIGN